MVTVQEIFDAAIDLMDELNESTGATVTVDTKEYKLRTISILNTAIPQLYPYSSSYDPTASGRPSAVALSANDRKEPDFDQDIPLDDDLCWALLPFYLASLLSTTEDADFSMRMMTEYNKALSELKDKTPAEFEPISLPYGGF